MEYSCWVMALSSRNTAEQAWVPGSLCPGGVVSRMDRPVWVWVPFRCYDAVRLVPSPPPFPPVSLLPPGWLVCTWLLMCFGLAKPPSDIKSSVILSCQKSPGMVGKSLWERVCRATFRWPVAGPQAAASGFLYKKVGLV